MNNLNKGYKIKLIFEDGKREEKLILDKSRSIYTNIDYDITIIELKEKEFDLSNYLKIDDDIYTIQKFNENKSIYIIHYPKGEKVKYSIGTIKNIDSDYNIYHCCDTDEGSSGSPILNLNNFHVIGIHTKGSIKSNYDNYNMGKLIKYPIDDFINNKIIEEIILILKIEKKDINKNIYFLDNTDYKTNEKHYHDNLKELNERNTKIYLNGKIYKYSKYLIFRKEGIYEIKLLISINIKNCSYMFYNCKNIIKINFNNFNTNNVTNMSHMFSDCSNLSNLPDISKWNTNNVTNMSHMFSFCSYLPNLPYISK